MQRALQLVAFRTDVVHKDCAAGPEEWLLLSGKIGNLLAIGERGIRDVIVGRIFKGLPRVKVDVGFPGFDQTTIRRFIPHDSLGARFARFDDSNAILLRPLAICVDVKRFAEVDSPLFWIDAYGEWTKKD